MHIGSCGARTLAARSVGVLQRTELLVALDRDGHEFARKLEHIEHELLDLDAVRLVGHRTHTGRIDARDLLLGHVQFQLSLVLGADVVEERAREEVIADVARTERQPAVVGVAELGRGGADLAVLDHLVFAIDNTDDADRFVRLAFLDHLCCFVSVKDILSIMYIFVCVCVYGKTSLIELRQTFIYEIIFDPYTDNRSHDATRSTNTYTNTYAQTRFFCVEK